MTETLCLVDDPIPFDLTRAHQAEGVAEVRDAIEVIPDHDCDDYGITCDDAVTDAVALQRFVDRYVFRVKPPPVGARYDGPRWPWLVGAAS